MKTYIVKTKIGAEEKVMTEIITRLNGAGSMSQKIDYIGKMIAPTHLKGYILVEAIEINYLQEVLGLIGSNHILTIKGVKEVVGEISSEEAQKQSEPRKATKGLEIGMIVSFLSGAWKGDEAKITGINEEDESLTLELWGCHLPIVLENVRADSVRAT
jgi:transcription elongation factor Spt5